MRKRITILFILFSCMANAQNPVPAKPQKESVIILNATAHLGNGLVIPNAAIGFRAGKLTIVMRR